MKVICAGLNKTGTKTMAKALRLLGYTVYDFFDHVDYHFNQWRDLYCSGKSPDFASMYQGVDAVTDVPAAVWCEEIFEAFPDAKVVLTVRDNEEVWVQSIFKQFQVFRNLGVFLNFALPKCQTRSWKVLFLLDLVRNGLFGSANIESPLICKKQYRQHNDRVQSVIPTEKLLVFNVKQGWQPLCSFLGCDVPEKTFPKENVQGSFSKDEISKALHNFVFQISMGAIVVLIITSVVLVFM